MQKVIFESVCSILTLIVICTPLSSAFAHDKKYDNHGCKSNHHSSYYDRHHKHHLKTAIRETRRHQHQTHNGYVSYNNFHYPARSSVVYYGPAPVNVIYKDQGRPHVRYHENGISFNIKLD